MADIFVSYRRDDSEWSAGRLNDKIAAAFGEERVFFDTVTIEPGEDFHEVLGSRVGACKVLLAVIGPKWLEILEGRSGDDNDFVRIEIAEAVRRNIRIVPVLIDGAKPPPASSLPDDIKILSRRQAVQVRANTFRTDATQLIDFLKKFLKEPAKDQTATPAPAKSSKSPPPRQPQAIPVHKPFSTPLPSYVQEALDAFIQNRGEAKVQPAQKVELPRGKSPKVISSGGYDIAGKAIGNANPPLRPQVPPVAPVPQSHGKTSAPSVDPKASSSKAALNAHVAGTLPNTPKIGGKDAWSVGDLLRRASEADSHEAPPAKPEAARQPETRKQAHQAIDIAALSRAIEPTTAEDVWRRIEKGERGVLSPSLLTAEGKSLVEKIKVRYREDPKFKPTVETFLKEFEKALEKRLRPGTTSRAHQQLLRGESGRIYLLLAHLTGRL